MYDAMSLDKPSSVVDRGIALHKMIRLITLTLGGKPRIPLSPARLWFVVCCFVVCGLWSVVCAPCCASGNTNTALLDTVSSHDGGRGQWELDRVQQGSVHVTTFTTKCTNHRQKQGPQSWELDRVQQGSVPVITLTAKCINHRWKQGTRGFTCCHFPSKAYMSQTLGKQ